MTISILISRTYDQHRSSIAEKSKIGYYIQETKTTSGTRKIPMTADVEECFRKIIEKRNPPKAEPMVDGKSGFLYFDKNESICYSLHWEHYFQHIIQKYNNTYKVQMPVITLMYVGIPIAQIWQNPE